MSQALWSQFPHFSPLSKNGHLKSLSFQQKNSQQALSSTLALQAPMASATILQFSLREDCGGDTGMKKMEGWRLGGVLTISLWAGLLHSWPHCQRKAGRGDGASTNLHAPHPLSLCQGCCFVRIHQVGNSYLLSQPPVLQGLMWNSTPPNSPPSRAVEGRQDQAHLCLIFLLFSPSPSQISYRLSGSALCQSSNQALLPWLRFPHCSLPSHSLH